MVGRSGSALQQLASGCPGSRGMEDMGSLLGCGTSIQTNVKPGYREFVVDASRFQPRQLDIFGAISKSGHTIADLLITNILLLEVETKCLKSSY